MQSDRDEVPSGLNFPGLRDERRRGPLLAFVAVLTITGLALVWPIYPFFASIEPYVLGFPLSFAWVVLWLVVAFVALVLLYRTDRDD